MNTLYDNNAWITKPVTGGSYCSPLEKHAGSVNNILSYPQIIQQRLEQPELRVFRIGDAWFGFRCFPKRWITAPPALPDCK
ncbi:MAG: hypothetical protein R3E93_01535 [Thiothrix sp.]